MATVTAARKFHRAIFDKINVGDRVIVKAREGRVFCDAFKSTYTDTTEIEVAEIGNNYVRDVWGQQFSYTQIDRIIR